MPIIIQHQPSPAAVGVASFVSGLGNAADRRRREQLALMQRGMDRQFQFGMQERGILARQDAQREGFANDLRMQQLGFQNQQLMADRGFQQRQLMQDQEFQHQTGMQQAGFANQAQLQQAQAEAQARLWGDRSRLDAMEAADRDIRLGKAQLSTDDQNRREAIRMARSSLAADRNVPDDIRRAKERELDDAESRVLSQARPPAAPPPPQLNDFMWPSGTVGQGTAIHIDPKTGKPTALKIENPSDTAKQKELTSTQQQLFKLESSINSQRSVLRSQRNAAQTGPLHSEDEINAILQEQINQANAIRQNLAALQRPPVDGSPLGQEMQAGVPTPSPVQAPMPSTAPPVSTQPPGPSSQMQPGWRLGGAPKTPAGPVPVQTQADIQNLPNGAQWVAPDGQTGGVEKTPPPVPGATWLPDGRLQLPDGRIIKRKAQ